MTTNTSSSKLKIADLKFGIVIQGPIRSFGRTGKTIHINFEDVKESDCVDFDCTPYIQYYIDNFSNDFPIILSTWENENTSNLISENIKNFNILRNKDTTHLTPPRGSIISGNNKYRQILSTLNGLFRLKEAGCKYAIKVRSDQLVDLEGLIFDTLKITNKRSVKLIVPRYLPNQPDELADFYFSGHIDDMINIFQNYLLYPEIFDHVHHDFFYGFSHNYLGKPSLEYWMRSTNLYLDYIRQSWNFIYCPASKSVYETLIWRGDKIANASLNSLFLDDLPEDYSFKQIEMNTQHTLNFTK